MAKAGHSLVPTLCVGMHLARSVTTKTIMTSNYIRLEKVFE